MYIYIYICIHVSFSLSLYIYIYVYIYTCIYTAGGLEVHVGAEEAEPWGFAFWGDTAGSRNNTFDPKLFFLSL